MFFMKAHTQPNLTYFKLTFVNDIAEKSYSILQQVALKFFTRFTFSKFTASCSSDTAKLPVH